MDLPWRLLSWIDAELVRVFPTPVRIIFWAALAALGSMELYRALSPQERIKSLQADLGQVQARLDAHDGSFGDGWAMVRQMLGLSARRIALVAPATIIASLPLLVLVVWMSGAYRGERVLDVGPPWIGGWEATFFVALSAFALALKSVRRIA